MNRNTKRLWRQLTHKRQSQFVMLLLLMLICAVAEIVSLGSVLPFLGVLVAPEKVFNYPFISNLSHILGANNYYDLIFPLIFLFALAALIAGLCRILLLWMTTRIIHATGADLSIKLYQRTLYQPYQVHITRNSSSVIGGMSKVEVAVNVMTQLFMLISSLIFLIAIMSTLLVLNTLVAASVIICFGMSYVVIALLSRRTLLRNSKCVAQKRNQLIKSIQEGLGGIRDVLLDGTQSVYCDIYQKADASLRKAQGHNSFISQSPRFAMESIGIITIAMLTYFLSFGEGGLADSIPLLGVLAVGAQRMMPSLQQVYSAWTNIAGNQASLSDALDLLEQPVLEYVYSRENSVLPFQSLISLRQVSFKYHNNAIPVLSNISLDIEKGSTVGFIGPTGGGKSTLIDIIMGLLEPSSGSLEVDGVRVNFENHRAWQARIAHVPQSIFLSDSTIKENIAFGVPVNLIDTTRLLSAAHRAGIIEDIKLMPNQFETFVGERGVSLSGGQKQRIGIARALYKQADVLILDEATSALDQNMEEYVMNSIESLGNNITILIIAHRLTTLKNCSQIVELRNGIITNSGSYEKLKLS